MKRSSDASDVIRAPVDLSRLLPDMATNHQPLTRRSAMAAVSCVVTALAGCAGISVSSMVPPAAATNAAPINRSVRVLEIANPASSLVAPVTGDQLREALIIALTKGNVFRATSAGGESDLDLRTTIVSQTITRFRSLTALEFRRDVTINYEFLDRASGNTVWREAIRAEAGSTNFGGHAANVEAGGLSVRENLKLLLEGIAQRWPR